MTKETNKDPLNSFDAFIGLVRDMLAGVGVISFIAFFAYWFNK